MIFAIVFSFSALLSAQNINTNEELSNLKKQVTSLNSNNAELKLKLKNFERSSLGLQDSLMVLVKNNNMQVKALQDSFAAKKTEISAIRLRTDLMLHSLKQRKTAFYILIPLVLIILVLIYWQLMRNIKVSSEHNEKIVVNINKSLEELIQNNKKDIQNEIVLTKNALEQKIAELK